MTVYLIIQLSKLSPYLREASERLRAANRLAVAASLDDSLQRDYDFFARYGGEEFAAIFPGMEQTSLEHAMEIMRLAVEHLAIPHANSTVANDVTISLGGATIKPSREGSAQRLLERADEKLYEAKEAGRNRCRNGSA